MAESMRWRGVDPSSHHLHRWFSDDGEKDWVRGLTLVLKLTHQARLSSSQPLVCSILTTLKMRSSLASVQELTYPQEGHTGAHCSWRTIYPINSMTSGILPPVLRSPPRGNGFRPFVTGHERI